MKELYIGVMSGTSMDGVDIALCEIDNSTCRLLGSYEHIFSDELKNEILSIVETAATVKQLGELDIKLAKLFSDAINFFLHREQIDTANITAVGLHGQTLWHEPKGVYPFSMQLGDPSYVSAKTDLKVVADFRSMDIANGGQGAPFAPAFHKFLFHSLPHRVAVVNIGGMANITLLSKELQGWDCGAGNVLMDFWSMKCNAEPYDKNGAFAACGNVIEELLDTMLKDPYFQKKPPKSTGREYFNPRWLQKHLENFPKAKGEDVQRTLLELTAKNIANDINDANANLLILCGGGAKNGFLVDRLKELCAIHVTISDVFLTDGDFLEAMAFAWLAYKRIHNETVELSSVTGATKNSLLGGIYG